MAVLNFPSNPVEDQGYDSGDGRIWVYKDGAWRQKSSVTGMEGISLILNRYDLEIKATTGAANLNDAQVFTIDNSSNSVKNVTFSNLPAGRAMTVIIEVVGKVGVVNLPAGITYATGVDSTLANTRTMFVLFWNGQAIRVTNNIKF